jgi:hypothetical protein
VDSYVSRGHLTVGVALVICGALLALSGCKRFQRKHIPVDSVEELAYPRCADEPPDARGQLIGSGHLRSGPTHPDPTIVEGYEIRQHTCLMAAIVRQEWPLGTADLEVLYDAAGLPLRIWRRMTLPGVPDPLGHADIRRYELRTDPVTIKRRSGAGRVVYEQLLGGKPRVVIGPGRGLISMWIRRAKLKVGEKTRELAIDIRELEKIEPVTLLRERDIDDPALGGQVQVYTFYGKETVFTDSRGMVVGDLMGLRSHALLKTEAPIPMPLYKPLDPVGTP